MPSTPDDHQPQPGTPPQAGQPGPGPEWDGEDVLGGELTAGEIAELNRLDGDPDEDDPQCWEDPDTGAPECWLALPPDQQAREIEEACAARVPETIAAGFTHNIRGSGTGFSAGGGADLMLPGAELARHVGNARQRGLDALSDDELIGWTGAVQRLESWASGLKSDGVAELDRRRARPDGSPGEFVAPEVGKALTLTPWSAGIALGRARELSRFEPVAVLLRNGIIDPRRADVLVGKLELLPYEHAALVLDRVLRRAGELTSGELGAALDRAIKAVDPKAAIKRREKAQKDARVETWTEDAGSAALAGRDLDPADVIAADQQLTADARWLKAHGVQGTIQQLRAKALTTRAAGQPLTCLLPPSTDSAGASATPDPARQQQPRPAARAPRPARWPDQST